MAIQTGLAVVDLDGSGLGDHEQEDSDRGKSDSQRDQAVSRWTGTACRDVVIRASDRWCRGRLGRRLRRWRGLGRRLRRCTGCRRWRRLGRGRRRWLGRRSRGGCRRWRRRWCRRWRTRRRRLRSRRCTRVYRE